MRTVYLYECRVVFGDVDTDPWQNLACLLGNASPQPGSEVTTVVYGQALTDSHSR